MPEENFQGIAFPFRIDPQTKGIAKAQGAEKIRQNIHQLLRTHIGERVMQREYGCSLRQLLHEPNDDALHALIRYQIQTAIVRWAPEIVLQNVSISSRESQVYVEVSYVFAGKQNQISVSLDRL